MSNEDPAVQTGGDTPSAPIVLPEASRECIGEVGVDSGTLLMIDPCYLHLLDLSDWASLLPEGEHAARIAIQTSAGPRALGVVFRSPCGDGLFPVCALESGARDPENPDARDVIAVSVYLAGPELGAESAETPA